MTVEIIALITFGLFFLLLGLGFSCAFTMFATGVIGYLAYMGSAAVRIVVPNTFSAATTDVYIAIPLFIFMAQIFESSGIGGDMFDALYKWFGGLKGGLGVAVIAIGTIISFITGLVGTSTVLLGLIAYPQMAKRGYAKHLAIGTVLAAGVLGPIIPPSLPMIIVGGISNVSVGKLFMAGVIPGLLSTLLFIIYVLIVSHLNPALAPALPKEERVDWKEKFRSSRTLILPSILAIVVLGGIFRGVFTPSEAGGIGAAGALVCMAVRGRFNLKNLRQSVMTSIEPIGMVMWIIMGGTIFASIISAGRVGEYFAGLITGMNWPPYVVLAVILIVVFIEGLALDLIPIAFSNLPILLPLVIHLGYDPTWFVFIFTLDCVIGFLTPPFGPSIFYFLGLKHEGVTTTDVFLATIPWTVILISVLVINIVFPQTVMFLPNLMIK